MGYQRSKAFRTLLQTNSIQCAALRESGLPDQYGDVDQRLRALFSTNYELTATSLSKDLADKLADLLCQTPSTLDKYGILRTRIIQGQLMLGLSLQGFEYSQNKAIKYEGPLVGNRSLGMRAPPQYTFGLKDDELKKPLENLIANGRTVESNPFRQACLHFPFLFAHADVERDFLAVQDQYAFPILRVLELQRSMQRELGEERFSTGPLVWTIAICGGSVRIGGGYIKSENDKISYVGYLITLPFLS
jgi:hypothetical protein